MSRKLVAACKVKRTPGGPMRLSEGGEASNEQTAPGGLQAWQPASTTQQASPVSTPPPRKRARRALPMSDMQIEAWPAGSDSGSDVEPDENPDLRERTDTQLLVNARKLRNIEIAQEELGISPEETELEDVGLRIVREMEFVDVEWVNEEFGGDGETGVQEDALIIGEVDEAEGRVKGESSLQVDGVIREEERGGEGDRDSGDTVVSPYRCSVIGGSRQGAQEFTWSSDFTTFSGEPESYRLDPGPQTTCNDPTDLFMLVWDLPIVKYLVEQYNKYAINIIEMKAEEEGGLSQHLMRWKETTVEEMYRFLAVLNFMALGSFDRVDEYWSTGFLGMPEFRRIMPRNRFFFLMRFLHFVDNEKLSFSVRSYDRKIAKIEPIISHCNAKFSRLYTPQRHLSLDESLLLWKGRLSWKQCNRLKAARFGIKSFELCEAETGYLLKSILYAGKGTSRTDGALDGFRDHTSKVVLDVMDGYLDVGHCVVMDNWYNQLPLTRHLKLRKTDVIGTLDRSRQHVPMDIKSLDSKATARGKQKSLHCGDIAIVAWKDVKLVTTISTYHNADRVRCQRAGQRIVKPKVVVEYNKYMGGVDLKDQKLSPFHFERKRNLKWYMKVFRRLLNTSLLNAYIIYTKQPHANKMLTHRDFRRSVAEGLLVKFPKMEVARQLPQVTGILRLDGRNDHFPDHTPFKEGSNRRKNVRCIRCAHNYKRTEVTTICRKCNVPLCLGKCYAEYHTVADL